MVVSVSASRIRPAARAGSAHAEQARRSGQQRSCNRSRPRRLAASAESVRRTAAETSTVARPAFREARFRPLDFIYTMTARWVFKPPRPVTCCRVLTEPSGSTSPAAAAGPHRRPRAAAPGCQYRAGQRPVASEDRSPPHVPRGQRHWSGAAHPAPRSPLPRFPRPAPYPRPQPCGRAACGPGEALPGAGGSSARVSATGGSSPGCAAAAGWLRGDLEFRLDARRLRTAAAAAGGRGLDLRLPAAGHHPRHPRRHRTPLAGRSQLPPARQMLRARHRPRPADAACAAACDADGRLPPRLLPRRGRAAPPPSGRLPPGPAARRHPRPLPASGSSISDVSPRSARSRLDPLALRSRSRFSVTSRRIAGGTSSWSTWTMTRMA